MSDFTFNIADYKPIAGTRSHDNGPALPRNGFVVLSSDSDSRDRNRDWREARPAIVEIRSVREGHRTYPPRGKILRFSNPHSHRLYVMPGHDHASSIDDDPGPMVA